MDPQAAGLSRPEAHCALHEGHAFTAICPRCGTYMCPQCTEQGRYPVCPACRERTGVGAFPFRRGQWSLVELMRFCSELHRKHLSLMVLSVSIAAVLVFGIQLLPMLVLQLFEDQMVLALLLQFVLLVPQMLVQGLVTVGMLTIAVRVLRGEPASVSLLFSEWRKLGAFFVQGLVFNMVLLPGILLIGLPLIVLAVLGKEPPTGAFVALGLVVPLLTASMIYVSLGLAFGSLELVAQPRIGAIPALKNAWAIARSERLAILGVILLAGLFCGLGLLACLIGVLFTAGYALLLFAGLYLTLRNGAEDLSV